MRNTFWDSIYCAFISENESQDFVPGASFGGEFEVCAIFLLKIYTKNNDKITITKILIDMKGIIEN